MLLLILASVEEDCWGELLPPVQHLFLIVASDNPAQHLFLVAGNKEMVEKQAVAESLSFELELRLGR